MERRRPFEPDFEYVEQPKKRKRSPVLDVWLFERGLTLEDVEEIGGCLDEAERLANLGYLKNPYERRSKLKD